MTVFAKMPRQFRALAFAAFACLIGLPQSVHAWDWSWGGNAVKGSGVIKTEIRNVSGFNRVSIAIPANVDVVQGDTEGVVLEADDNILPLIETVVDDRGLQIRFKDRNTSVKSTALKARVNAKMVEGLSVGGSGNVQSGALRMPALKVSIGGSGNVKIASLDTENLTVSVAGSGDFHAAGKAKNVDARIAGSGDIKIGSLEANAVKISVAGSGDAIVWAKETLNVSVAGSGDIKYYGDAKVSQSVAGSGSVKRLGAVP